MSAFILTGELCAALLRKICEDSRSGNGAKIDAVDTFHGETPLHKAITANIERNVYELVRHGADRNLPDSTGNTALHKAASSCQDMAIWRQLTRKTREKEDVLPIHSLNFVAVNNDGLTPYDRAVEAKNYVAQIVLRAKQNEHDI